MPVEIIELIVRARVHDEQRMEKEKKAKSADKKKKKCPPVSALEPLQEMLRRQKER